MIGQTVVSLLVINYKSLNFTSKKYITISYNKLQHFHKYRKVRITKCVKLTQEDTGYGLKSYE